MDELQKTGSHVGFPPEDGTWIPSGLKQETNRRTGVALFTYCDFPMISPQKSPSLAFHVLISHEGLGITIDYIFNPIPQKIETNKHHL